MARSTPAAPSGEGHLHRLPSRVPGLTALRLDLFPDSNDPKAAPERGQVFSKIQRLTRHPRGLQSTRPTPGTHRRLPRRLRSTRTRSSIRQRLRQLPGHVRPAPWRPRPAKPLQAPEGATLELTLEHGIASNSGVQGCSASFRVLFFHRPQPHPLRQHPGTPRRLGSVEVPSRIA
jgi:hypothetical protein